MLGIITGTIFPDKNIEYLTLRNENERLEQYIDSLKFFIESKAFSKIIFCDNSNYKVEKLQFLKQIAKKNRVNIEILSFQGDIEKVKKHGKGYGEGEIIHYIFNNSKLIKGEQFFVKITGRIKIHNIKEITKRLDIKKIYFNIPNHTRRDMYDTRIYAIPIDIFSEFFLLSYDRVMDVQKMYLEYVYTYIIRNNHIPITNFPRYPRLTGISGTGGSVYTYKEWKCKIKDIVGMLGGYKVKNCTWGRGEKNENYY